MSRLRPHIAPVLCLIIALSPLLLSGQTYSISGRISEADTNDPLEGAVVRLDMLGRVTTTDLDGEYRFEELDPGVYFLTVSYLGRADVSDTLRIANDDLIANYALGEEAYILDDIEISSNRSGDFGMQRLSAVEGTAIYASKKSEVVVIDKMTANLASNLSRQVYAKVPGLNIWESDGAGVQLGIGGRGLSPDRSSNFNTRQNGYDISADALGYPESYYTPPVEALDRIEIVRGAASLQYGTQFGGMLNFRFREGAPDRKIRIVSRQTGGSFGFFNSFNSLGGTVDKLNYYGFYQFKRTDGWRPNSEMKQHTAYASFRYELTPRLTIRPEYTHMNYLAHQPGGLTDAQFEADPGQSNRERNWFEVNWNLLALTADYALSGRTAINLRTFGLFAGRDALGNLESPNVSDFGGERDYISDRYRNWGAEMRIINRYFIKARPSTVLVGVRYYNGFTDRKQGLASDGRDPDFEFLNPDNLEGSDFELPSRNFSAFAENVFTLSEQWSITPGMRFEYIRTEAEGYYRNIVTDLANNVIEDSRNYESRTNERSFVFFGIGSSFRPNDRIEIYGNLSQNYRAINFNDIRVNVGGLVVDPDLSDERGFNADIGIRGSVPGTFNFDVSLFHLSYKDRIGTILRKEPNPNFNNLVDRVVRYRTNIADARIYGLEFYGEVSILALLGKAQEKTDLSVFLNGAFIRSRYVNSAENGVEGNRVELVPEVNTKAGISARAGAFRATMQFGFVSQQFSDASNAVRTPTAIEGIIPAYHVMDLSMAYTINFFTVEAGVNNFTNSSYFTRRASGYPGPGIIPSEPRTFYLTLAVTL